MTHIVHCVRDLTGLIVARRSLDEDLVVVREQRETIERMARDVSLRERALAERRETIDRALLQRRPCAEEALRVNDYLSPRDVIPRGIYRVIHRSGCFEPYGVYVGADGQVVQECSLCGAGVRYRLLQRLG